MPARVPIATVRLRENTDLVYEDAHVDVDGPWLLVLRGEGIVAAFPHDRVAEVEVRVEESTDASA